METYKEYFSNLTTFVFKKDILETISKLYNVNLSADEYAKIIKQNLVENIIVKSSNSPGKCGYISSTFIAEQGMDAVTYYKTKKLDSQNLKSFTKKSFSDVDLTPSSDFIVQVQLKDVFNEL